MTGSDGPEPTAGASTGSDTPPAADSPGGGGAGAGPGARPGPARDEAERLVSSLLGAASVAIQSAETRRQLRNLAEAVQGTPAARQVRDLADRVLGGDWLGSGTSAATSAAPEAGTDPAGGEASGQPGAQGGGHRTGFATGGPECCVCPVCRVVAVLRDPSPEFAERLAAGAGDLAAGISQVLRAFGDALAGGTAGGAYGRPSADDPWASATRDPNAGVHPPEQRKPMAKKAVRKPAEPDADA